MRIITGSARGTKLKTPAGNLTRPTADRVKESLFSILGQSVTGAAVLDLFAGSGALGLEALSRGARSAVFVDKNTAGIIADNATRTHLRERAEIFPADVFAVLPRLINSERIFDIVFCDPPYKTGLANRACEKISPLLTDESLVIVEHGADEFADEDGFSPDLHLCRRVGYGRTTAISIFRKT